MSDLIKNLRDSCVSEGKTKTAPVRTFDTGGEMMTEAIQKFALERPRKVAKGQFPWASCAPFVENSRGTLIHRPRSGSTYNLHRTGPHVGIHFWCGMVTSSDGKNLTFLAFPPEGRVLCERCEVAAVINGLPSADELAGRHVHKGRTIAIATCCKDAEA